MYAAHSTWIEDQNRWSLPAPPAWWQRRLSDFDAQLVLIPSRSARRYLLARRRQYSAGLGDVAMLDNQHPDTNMCYAHGVVPVATLTWGEGASTFTAHALTLLLDELRRRDTWALSGGPTTIVGATGEQRLIDAVEAQEAASEQRAKAQLQDGFRAMARDAWRSLQARAGWRNKRASDYHGVARQPANSGTVH